MSNAAKYISKTGKEQLTFTRAPAPEHLEEVLNALGPEWGVCDAKWHSGVSVCRVTGDDYPYRVLQYTLNGVFAGQRSVSW